MFSTATMFYVASVLALTMVVFPLHVSAIWCYQCSSQTDEDCATLKANDTSTPHYRQCGETEESRRFNGSKEFFCRKISQTIQDRGGLVRIIRRCGWIQHRLPCYTYDSMGHHDIVCQCFTDGCNSALPMRNKWPIGVLSGAVILIVNSLR